ncbi:hypothetical protein V502_03552 [Pseudogymnoascus sp. VKM F-4520 (FW-2644)]|nr:hypothetical protein V502_03552 [Pseudogymnoascus sp. VKM F-4520 (FW-2644)]
MARVTTTVTAFTQHPTRQLVIWTIYDLSDTKEGALDECIRAPTLDFVGGCRAQYAQYFGISCPLMVIDAYRYCQVLPLTLLSAA